jgi:hypothetical protein
MTVVARGGAWGRGFGTAPPRRKGERRGLGAADLKAEVEDGGWGGVGNRHRGRELGVVPVIEGGSSSRRDHRRICSAKRKGGLAASEAEGRGERCRVARRGRDRWWRLRRGWLHAWPLGARPAGHELRPHCGRGA